MMNKKLILLLGVTAGIFGVPGISAESTITWETLGNKADDSGQYYIQRFTLDADAPFERLAFCMFKRGMETVSPSDTLIELLPGYFAIGSDRFSKAKPGKPVVIDIRTKGALCNDSYEPDGMHLVSAGKAVPATNVKKCIVTFPAQYQTPTDKGIIDPMIYGDKAYAINDSLRSEYRPGPFMDIPTPKSLYISNNMVTHPVASGIKVVQVDDPRHDYYRAELTDSGLTVYTNSDVPEAVVASVLRRIDRATVPSAGTVREVVIEDWADLPYRAFMLDVARNFTPMSDVKSIVDLMAGYGLNVLHLHLGDDEAWRLEIPSLPELTEVGSRRGYCTDDDQPYLKQIYSGDGLPDSDTPANGYYTMPEYIDLLKYARQRGIDIIPEFDTPGHARAAIRAMEHRYSTTGDASLRLIHDGDTSEYTSAQAFHDNILNPALDGPYKFWDILMGEMVDAYAQAGVPLRALHIGGDEVPKHAWDGSAAVKALMEREGLTSQNEVHAYFVERVAELAAKHGIKIAGWQEIALNHSAGYDATVQPTVAGVNCWTNAGKYGAQMAEKGYPLILSNVDYLYFDQIHTSHPQEPGLKWGGIVDEFSPLHATVDRLCPGTPEVQENVAGISAQLFAETVRSTAMVERYILPRILGLAERAHNAKPTITDTEYFGYLTAEMDRWAEDGRNFFLRQPGIRVTDGMVEMNEAYGKGEIRYTLDGSEPTAESALYSAPIPVGDASQVRARLFYGPAESVTSILYIQ